MKEASPKFEVWVSEALNKYAASFAKDGAPPPVAEPPKEEVVRVEEAPKEVVYKGDPKEVQELKRITQKQQEEISKLLLTIDELRKRMENIKVVSLDAGPGVAGTVDNIMEKVGLKDIMEAGMTRNPPVLKGVFERLYSDAIQRIQRYGLIRQQMLLANKAYAAVVEAVASEQEEPRMPDFERLNDTTDATIRGMWYHTEYLFRRACEYAMTQGVEASLVKAQQSLVSEFEALVLIFFLKV
ncbi:cs1 [Symbiodinium pilosum]|uniref:Cs1 protein n=1 Tax=Symbiodinium pilosum TaxID=2952 RepID=A0A812XTU7_SYMPI|nr:cs1 [Symbiodinium pilosum]